MTSAPAPSEPRYGIVSESNVMVSMRDGVRLAADVYRPDVVGRFPALLAMSPYGKELQGPPLRPLPPGSPTFCGGAEAGDTDFLVPRGYVHVIADVRGTCKSEGVWKGWTSTQEGEDGFDLVEWIAKQSWCDGSVGMIGISYFAAVQWMVAAEQPPHLKAIFPYDSPADYYRDTTYHGGLLNFFTYDTFVRPGAGRVWTEDELSPEEFQAALGRIRKDPDVRMYPLIRSKAENPRGAPCFVDVLLHPTDGPFHWERSSYTRLDRIQVPVYTGSGWYAYGYFHLAGAFKNYTGLSGTKKMMLTPKRFLDRPWYEYHDVVLRWFDHWLKGIDTGIMDEPPIRLFTMGANTWRHEQEWPLARTRFTKLYLRAWKKLAFEPEPYFEEPDCFVQQPLFMTTDISSLNYETEPLAADLEVTGPIELTLYAAIDQPDTNWIVALRDVFPDRSEIELTRGWLKASHREVDAEKSTPGTPWHPHTHPEPVEPGEIYEYTIELVPNSNLFRVGHRVRLVIMAMDRPGATPLSPGVYSRIFPPHLCSSTTVVHRVFRNREYQSHLLLPVIPGS